MGKVLFVILAVFLLLGAFATPILDGIKVWRTQNTTQAFSVTTAAAVTSANVTLSKDLFDDNIAEVITVTSSKVTETPVVTSYTAATNKLLISALDASNTRTLTVNYYAESDSDVLKTLGPFLGLLILGGLIFVIFRQAGSKRGGR